MWQTLVKHDTKVTFRHKHHAQVVQDIIKKHRIPVSEGLVCYKPASLLNRGLNSTSEAANKGTIFIFSNTIVFKFNTVWMHFSSDRSDVILPIRQIKYVKAVKNTLIVTTKGAKAARPSSEISAHFSLGLRPSRFLRYFRGQHQQTHKVGVSSDTIDTASSVPEQDAEMEFVLTDRYACVECKHHIRLLLEEVDGRAGAEAWLARRSSVLASDKWFPTFHTKRGPCAYSDEREQEALSTLFRHSQFKVFKAGDIILPQGATENCLFSIVSGVVGCKSSCGKVGILMPYALTI